MAVKVRFAPSPTGKLHVGNVRAALFNWLFARRTAGTFLLRSDDTDRLRSTTAFEDQIRHDLTWLGLHHDEFARQSERFDAYRAVAEELKAQSLLYPCYETPEELDRQRKLRRARGLPPVYDRAALSLSPDEKAALEAEGRQPHWRFKLSRSVVEWDDMIRGETKVDTSSISDPVLIREDGQFLYTLPSCVDDVDMGITHIIRGEDHVTNTAAQLEIFAAILSIRGGGDLPQFGHHSLLVGKDGEQLSKRLGSLTIEDLRAQGIEAAAITSLLARLGTADPVIPAADLDMLAEGFAFDRLGRAPARFNQTELIALNARLLHEMPYERLKGRLAQLDIDDRLWEAVKGNIETIADACEWRDIIEKPIEPVIAEEDRPVTEAAAAAVPDREVGPEDWPAIIDAVKAETGRKGKKLFMPLRLALTGKSFGPEMPVLFTLIGAARAKQRFLGEDA
ncbi:glutamyl-tRNA synthetase [Parvularcula bermudensis HTCC2503]|uniref:Glutamate--tRNA ligase n=1 Tax=Parvularcula bermudensis (strain ATCC BAA-594 / HTCC2503 / KCTC 12087) TaxID=314260 RepID=E0TFG4_PARBH|nr:glutamate--tRNA ligase [Parvularcula bermudensis]ADM10088.1 glutamyl-tRNA synthetase [Parvularcula bermudensis HTCC2503]